jgi:hypothetical protein
MAAAPSIPFAVVFQLRRNLSPPQAEQPASIAAVFPMLLSPVKCIPPPFRIAAFQHRPGEGRRDRLHQKRVADSPRRYL